jgi:hypothetical protein
LWQEAENNFRRILTVTMVAMRKYSRLPSRRVTAEKQEAVENLILRTERVKEKMITYHKKKIKTLRDAGRLCTMAHACNHSYLEDRDWEDGGLRPAQAKS